MSHQITRPVNLSGREIAMQTRRIGASRYCPGLAGVGRKASFPGWDGRPHFMCQRITLARCEDFPDGGKLFQAGNS